MRIVSGAASDAMAEAIFLAAHDVFSISSKNTSEGMTDMRDLL